jgi:ankyrin repeat protein
MLLAQGEDANQFDSSDGWTCVHWATRNGAADALEEICLRSSVVNNVDNFAISALHLACRDGRVEEVRVLLRHASHVNGKTEDTHTPLMLGARGGHTEVIAALAESKALRHEEAQISVDESSLSSGAAVPAPYDPSGPLRLEEVDREGLTALLWACLRDQPGAVEALIHLGANVEARDLQGRTCLIVASQCVLRAAGFHAGTDAPHCSVNAAGCVRALIAGGALLDAQANDGSTAAIAAASEGRAEALQVLVQAGASCLRPANQKGETPLSLSSHAILASLLDADPSRCVLKGGEEEIFADSHSLQPVSSRARPLDLLQGGAWLSNWRYGAMF